MFPLQSVNVYVYVTSPSQVGVVEITAVLGVNVFPQLSVTAGTVGATMLAAQATVEPWLAGIAKSLRSIVNI